jgi:hypothetical protein
MEREVFGEVPSGRWFRSYDGRGKIDGMGNVGWLRVVVCGLLAGVVWVGLGTIVTALLGRGLLLSPTTVSVTPTAGFLLLQIGIDLVEGISILRLYAAIRPRYEAGAKTALIAAFAWWFIVTLGNATWCSFGFFPPRTVIRLMIGTLPALIIATLAGARFYRE